jgi:Domain of unknown function (DUF2017)
MQPFRSTRGGGVRAWLAASEASLLRNLVDQVVALITPDGPTSQHPTSQDSKSKDPKTKDPKSKADDEIAALEALLHEPAPGTAQGIPQDPVLARLLPDGYRDDPEAADEFRKYTEPSLRDAKQQAAQQMLDSLPEGGGRVQLTADQAQAWLKALNDVRLALGIRLDVSEDFEDQWGRLTPEDPQWTAFEVYAWLGAVQESLVQALTP